MISEPYNLVHESLYFHQLSNLLHYTFAKSNTTNQSHPPRRPTEDVHFELTQKSGKNDNTEIENSSFSDYRDSRASKTLPHDAKKCTDAMVFWNYSQHPLKPGRAEAMQTYSESL